VPLDAAGYFSLVAQLAGSLIGQQLKRVACLAHFAGTAAAAGGGSKEGEAAAEEEAEEMEEDGEAPASQVHVKASTMCMCVRCVFVCLCVHLCICT
jgi:ribosomal protein L12E/L44/L45/RPP1/RPP2